MPDFDTRKPQGSDEANRPRMTLIANRLSRLLSASKVRILSIASMLRDSLMANKRRSLFVGGVLLFVIAPASVGLLIYTISINTPSIREMSPDREEHTLLSPDSIAETYWRLHEQDRTAWTLESDLRPSVESF
jgi:hypothetical protein